MPADSNNVTEQPVSSQQTAGNGESVSPATSQYSTDYKERLNQIKSSQQKALNDLKSNVVNGIENGQADQVAETVGDILYTVLCAPYDLLNYAVITFMSLTTEARTKFVQTGWLISGILGALFLLGFVLTLDLKYIIDLVSCAVAALVLYMVRDLQLSASINLDELVQEDDLYL